MASFSTSLEQALRRALQYANERSHEYATLEHLLLSLIDDRDAAAVMRACDVDLDLLRDKLTGYIDNELSGLVLDTHGDAQPTAGFQRVIHRAVAHVQSSRPRGGDRRQRARRHLRRAGEPCRVLPARAAHDPLRRGQLYQPRHRQARRHVRAAHRARRRRRRGDGRRRRREEARRRCARGLLHQPQPEGALGPHRSSDRARARDPAHHPGAVPPPEEQPAVRGRSRRRQDGHRRRSWRAASSWATCRRC